MGMIPMQTLVIVLHEQRLAMVSLERFLAVLGQTFLTIAIAGVSQVASMAMAGVFAGAVIALTLGTEHLMEAFAVDALLPRDKKSR